MVGVELICFNSFFLNKGYVLIVGTLDIVVRSVIYI